MSSVRLADLLARWQESAARGEQPTPQQLCPDQPDLWPELARGIEALRARRRLAGAESPPTASVPPTLPPTQNQPSPSTVYPTSQDRAAPASPAPPPAGPAGRYEPLHLHARGGLGEVFVARDQELAREVALKEIQPRHANDPHSRARFLLEAEVTGRLEHPGVVPVYGLGRHPDGRPYYAMRFIRGKTLREAIDQLHLKSDDASRGLELRALLTRFVAVCNAVAYAHSRGVIHRDLKPDNVMLGPFGETLVVDWGLAKVVGKPDVGGGGAPSAGSGHAATQAGAVVGTPAYMSPEQAAGKTAEVGPATDVYALGGILYTILTGQVPYAGRNVLEVLAQVREGKLAPPRQLDRRVPAALSAICARAMARAPRDRYGAARELAADVERWLADEPVAAHRESAGERARRWARRNRAWVRAGVAALVLVAGVSAGAALLINGARVQESQARQREAEEAARANENAAEADKQRGLAEANLKLSEARRVAAARLALGRGLALCKTGDSHQGMLWVAHALEIAPPDDADLNRTIRIYLAGWSRDQHVLRSLFAAGPKRGPLAVSPDGKLLATADGGKVTLRSATDGEARPGGLAHPRAVELLAFSPDGGTLAAVIPREEAKGDQLPPSEVWLWDVQSARRRVPPLSHDLRVTALAFGPGGKTLATGAARYRAFSKAGTGEAGVWDAEAGRRVGRPIAHADPVVAVSLSPDGKLLLTGTASFGGPGEARVWEAATGKALSSPLRHQSGVRAVAFSPKGDHFLTATTGAPPFRDPKPGEFEARLWSAETFEPAGQPMRHGADLTAEFSPDGKAVITASADRTARLWAVPSGRPLSAPLQHTRAVTMASFSPDSGLFVTASAGNIAEVGDARGTERVGHALPHASPVVVARFAGDGRAILTQEEQGHVRLWALRPGPARGVTLAHEHPVWCVAVSADGTRALTGGDGKVARVWGLEAGKPAGPALEHESRVLAAAFSPDGKVALTGTAGGKARLWDLSTGAVRGGPLEHEHVVDQVAFSKDGKLAFTGTLDHEPSKGPLGGPHQGRAWDVATGRPAGAGKGYRAVLFGRDGTRALKQVAPTTVQLWDVEADKPAGPPLAHREEVVACALAPDNKTAMVRTVNDVCRWDAATGRAVASPLLGAARGLAVTFNPKGTWLLTGTGGAASRYYPGFERGRRAPGSGVAWLWDFRSGHDFSPPLPHKGEVTAVAFSPDGRRMLTGSLDGTAQVWPVPQALQGPPARVTLWAQVTTGLELDATGTIQVLDPATWAERRRRLAALGGPPTW